MGWFSDAIDNAVGSVVDVVQAPAATISGAFDNAAVIVNHPILNPVGAITSEIINQGFGITPGQQLMAGATGGMIGAALGIGTGAAVAFETAAVGVGGGGGAMLGGGASVGGIAAIHEGVKPIIDAIKPAESAATTSNTAPAAQTAPAANNTPLLLMAGLVAAKLLLF